MPIIRQATPAIPKMPMSCLNTVIPTTTDPTDPMPVQIGYAIPKGKDRIDQYKAPRLASIKAAVAMSKLSLKPPERDFRPAAHAVSNKPAIKSAIHAISTSIVSGRPGKPIFCQVVLTERFKTLTAFSAGAQRAGSDYRLP
tara:strand:- start:600 stop:1022 length:423 start_codon:yes stop_codon:yes gene_type:complete